ncbi:phosphate ABC transporter permease PstA [Alienimonas californiensis]|uniref:phosphate ABC transporter permease PstA n=1 Tax=Alienimonas californiensis TaxID=2527989 RepID=UPI001A97E71F|nr:phosphate ABC transporter permease PstA [Alienimonas californiensis]
MNHRPAPAALPARRVRGGPARSVVAGGEPAVWLSGAALIICLVMIFGLLGLILWNGVGTFWPGHLVQVSLRNGDVLLGEPYGTETYELRRASMALLPDEARAAALAAFPEGEDAIDAVRVLLRTDNRRESGSTFTYVNAFEVAPGSRTEPEWAVVLERADQGRFLGEPVRLISPEGTFEGPAEAWAAFERLRPAALERNERAEELEDAIAASGPALNEARLRVRSAEMRTGVEGRSLAEALARSNLSEAERGRLEAELEEKPEPLRGAVAAFAEAGRRHALLNAPRGQEMAELAAQNAAERLVMRTAAGREVEIETAEVVRGYRANALSWWGRLGVYLSRWWEFLSEEPRQAGTAGGVWPAIWGTVTMTLVMTVAVVPFGVLAALYLREYAAQGLVVSAVRVAVNNLAGVPSIVFGVFGLGFFCYLIGGGVDQLFYAERLPDPTFGKGGLLWASLTLALLTLPVVIVATEEALSAVPNSMREGSYACGASKWQTIRRIVLPRALPGILTGTILAVARGAGEVAPLMLVGAVNTAPALPVDFEPPFVHPSRSFMHLGFHIYDLGFQAPDGDAARPMVYTTMLLLIALVAVLNLAAMWLRARLRRRYVSASF